MDDAHLVGRAQPSGDLARETKSASDRQLAFSRDQGGQVEALDEGHREVLHAAELAEIVNPDDMLVRHLAGDDELTLESPLQVDDGVRIGHDLGANELERDRQSKFVVPRLVDNAHAALSKPPEDAVARTELRSRGEEGVEADWRGQRQRGQRRRLWHASDVQFAIRARGLAGRSFHQTRATLAAKHRTGRGIEAAVATLHREGQL